MALGNGSTPAAGGVTQEKAPVVNGTNMETLPRTGKQVIFVIVTTFTYLIMKFLRLLNLFEYSHSRGKVFNGNLKRNYYVKLVGAFCSQLFIFCWSRQDTGTEIQNCYE